MPGGRCEGAFQSLFRVLPALAGREEAGNCVLPPLGRGFTGFRERREKLVHVELRFPRGLKIAVESRQLTSPTPLTGNPALAGQGEFRVKTRRISHPK